MRPSNEERKELYKKFFVSDPDGARILEDLVSMFYDREIFVSGPDGDRLTAFKAGSRKTVAFILGQCAQVDEDGTDSL